MRMRTRLLRLVGVFTLATAPMAATVVFATAAGADDFTVTNTNDSGAGSLRQAIADAASAGHPGDDVIDVQAGLGTITLTSGEIFWNGNFGDITINGNGVTLNAGGAPIALNNDGGDGITVNDMTITGVGGSTASAAAAIVAQGGPIVVSNCVITGNNVHSTADHAAGALLNEGGTITVNGCTLSNNTAITDDEDVAGAIVSEGGAVAVSASAIRDNTGTGTATAEGDGAGGILSEGGNVTVGENTTITGNSTTTNEGDAGGGINSQGGTVVVALSVISGNSATAGSDFDAGGGILSSGNSVTVRSSTLNCNSATSPDSFAGGGIPAVTETVTINGSFVEGNTAVGRFGQDNAIFVGNTGTIEGTGNTINDDTSVCAAPVTPPLVVTPAFTG